MKPCHLDEPNSTVEKATVTEHPSGVLPFWHLPQISSSLEGWGRCRPGGLSHDLFLQAWSEGLEAVTKEPHRKRYELGGMVLPFLLAVDTILILHSRSQPARRDVGPASNITQKLTSPVLHPSWPENAPFLSTIRRVKDQMDYL